MKISRFAAWLLVALVLFGGLAQARAGAPKKKQPAEPAVPAVRVLVISGVDHPAHLWKETGPALRTALEKGKRLEVRLVEDPEFLASDAVFDYDVLLMHFKNYGPLKRAEQAQANLARFAEQGKGLVLFHFACGAFEEWPGFLDLAGRVWDKTKRGHDPRGPFTVQVTDRQHPIMRGMNDFEIPDELYTCLGGDRPIHVLATARSKVDGQDYPMAFTWQYGKARVFHVALGHDVEAIVTPELGMMVERGCLWAAGRE